MIQVQNFTYQRLKVKRVLMTLSLQKRVLMTLSLQR